MDTTKLKKFAQGARRQLIEQVSARMEQVLRVDSVEVREKAKVVEQLKAEIEAHGKKAVVDKVAYTWFNRFCALRFMDVNHYTRIGAVSPVEGGTQPEVLLEAKQGHIDEDLLPDVKKRQEIFDLLSGRRPSSDGQGEAYRLLLVGMCNAYGEWMPFLFEKIEDFTELLMPLDLLSENSALHDLREALSAEACEDVEVIGWLYQYYISERKDEVFEALKQNQKIEAEDIPAATQLFTPHWIVRYLVENSLGRLWMLNHPNSRLRERMEYYIAPADDDVIARRSGATTKQSPTDEEIASGKEQERPRNDVLVINSPEELKLLDPACGSGHILTYAFDLLYAIYEEEGYASNDIPRLILERNIFGVEIDGRAGALAAFALTMKARAKDRRFFARAREGTRGVLPQICVLENVTFNESELKQYMKAVDSGAWDVGSGGGDLFTSPLMETLRQFEQAENFGSLIRPLLGDVQYVREILESKNLGGDLFLYGVHERVLKVLKFAEFLAPRYHVVVANPPYMGSKGMNDNLREFAKAYFDDSNADLFAMFIDRGFDLTYTNGYSAMVTMQSWMFLSSYESFRLRLLGNYTIECMVHMSNMVMGIAFGTAATVWQKNLRPSYKGHFSYVDYGDLTEDNLPREFPVQNDRLTRSSTSDLHKIPGSPIAYWVSPQIRAVYDNSFPLHEFATPRAGMITGDNASFVRFWHEIEKNKLGLNVTSRTEAKKSYKKWFPYQKGGPFRKWFGNKEHVVNWENDGHALRTTTDKTGKVPAHAFNEEYIFQHNVNWSALTSSKFSARITKQGALFDASGSAAFPQKYETTLLLCGLLNSPIVSALLSAINPTLNFQAWEIGNLPLTKKAVDEIDSIGKLINKLEEIAETDWNNFETSWDFRHFPLLSKEYDGLFLSNAYYSLQKKWAETVIEMKQLEEESNKALIEAYELQSEIISSVPLNEITLTCNPHYRYGGNREAEELDALLRADTMKEFISYAVGCMFGRYSLDKPGLVLANQGETLKDYLRKVGSEEWIVDSKGENHDDSSQLQRVDRLAESDELGGNRLSGNETISEGRTLRSDESNQAFSSFDSIEHSGRSSQKINGGISEFLVNCERFKSRDGDPNPACPALELCNERYRAANSQSVGRGKPIVVRTDEQSEITPHCPLSTIHFLPDEDNAIPVLEGEWFNDDVAERFKKFLRVTFGEEHYEENLAFIEEAIGRDVRSYFVKEFYKDHVQTYKKRPIYWMFSSPKGSFNVLIYMHRYQPDTVSIVLNGYLREYVKKLNAHKSQLERTSVSGSASQSQKTKALKEIQQVNKVLSELKEYEDEVLYPLATQRVSIDLDDGVKVNYRKFGGALSPIKGL